ncbi:MAG: sigma-70 family RNA polymerase sigma factor [Oscillospiraceae bacterium]|nr:sigma-70 family RNA polymerase sigma factor [Oscillospiraceae bacterium]
MKLDVQQLLAEIREAKSDAKACDRMIEQYMPFIRSETAKFLKRSPAQDDDELSIAMFAFYEAIRNYSPIKGAFLRFAALSIRSRLIDNYRKERRNQGHISLDTPIGNEEDGLALIDTVEDESRPLEELGVREATQQEIAHLTQQMSSFGVSLTDVADNAPQQKRTLAACQKAIRYAREHQELLEEFLRTKRVPIKQLAEGAGVEKKTLERHRRYLVAVLLVCTNGYEIMRSHIMQVLKGGEVS